MKIFKYGLPFAALALLASCSNDNIDAPNVDNENSTPVEGMYLSFNLAMTGAQGTREGETYDQGTTDENAIYNAHLYLYQAANTNTQGETGAAFKGHYELGLGTVTPGTGAINEIQEVTFQIADLTEADVEGAAAKQFYAFIVVNQPETGFTAPSGESTSFSAWNTSADNALSASGRASYANMTAKTRVTSMIPELGEKLYFTMTNAPLLVNDGTSKKVNYLVQLDNSQFKKSPAEAKDAAGTVYVQRGVAKVRVSKSESVSNMNSVEVDDLEQVKVDFTGDGYGWALDILSSKTYPVQLVEAETAFTSPVSSGADWSKNHFWSTALEGNGTAATPSKSNIWWAKDYNYDKVATNGTPANFLTALAKTNTDWNSFTADQNYEYCLENTMDYQAQQKFQSTRIVFKGKLLLPDGASGTKSAPESFVVYPGTDRAVSVADVTVTDPSNSNTTPVDGKYKLSDLLKVSTELEAKRKALGMATGNEYVYYYPDGVTYYTAIIRHFDDTQAPLTTDGNVLADNKSNAASVDDADEYEKWMLGRYGVLRNNTYEVKVAKVMGYGLPDIPTPKDEPDDNPDPVKYNVIMDIKVLNWGLRSNEYTLK